MKFQNISDTDLKPSVICFGGGALSRVDGRTHAYRQLDLYLEAGGNFIDTANIYGKWLEGETNLSEQYIGAWLADRQMRNRVLLTTKGGHPHLNAMQISRLSRPELMADLEESLQSLRTDHVDLYFLHRDDPQRTVEEILDTLEDMCKQGKIRWYGCSNWSCRRIREAQVWAREKGLRGFSVNQTMWSLAVPNPDQLPDPTLVPMETDTLQLHRRENWTAMLYSSQAGGYFDKRISLSKDALDANLRKVYDNPVNDRRLSWALTRAAQLNCTVGELVLGYLLAQSFPAFPIIGPRTEEQLLASMKAGERTWPASLAEEVENLSQPE